MERVPTKENADYEPAQSRLRPFDTGSLPPVTCACVSALSGDKPRATPVALLIAGTRELDPAQQTQQPRALAVSGDTYTRKEHG